MPARGNVVKWKYGDKGTCIIYEGSVDSSIPIFLCRRNLVAISTLYLVGNWK